MRMIEKHLHIHQHIPVLNLDGINVNPGLGIAFQAAGGRVILPTVPWADDFAVLDISLAERAAHVQAYVIDSRAGAVHISHADSLAADLEFLGLAGGGEICLNRNLCVCHFICA